jgi:hypothetical protein
MHNAGMSLLLHFPFVRHLSAAPSIEHDAAYHYRGCSPRYYLDWLAQAKKQKESKGRKKKKPKKKVSL